LRSGLIRSRVWWEEYTRLVLWLLSVVGQVAAGVAVSISAWECQSTQENDDNGQDDDQNGEIFGGGVAITVPDLSRQGTSAAAGGSCASLLAAFDPVGGIIKLWIVTLAVIGKNDAIKGIVTVLQCATGETEIAGGVPCIVFFGRGAAVGGSYRLVVTTDGRKVFLKSGLDTAKILTKFSLMKTVLRGVLFPGQVLDKGGSAIRCSRRSLHGGSFFFFLGQSYTKGKHGRPVLKPFGHSTIAIARGHDANRFSSDNEVTFCEE
jgi:hypothetical protein